MRAPALALLFTGSVFAASNLLPPDQWTAARGQIKTDRTVQREGRPSLLVESSGADAEVFSQPVRMTIGKTYEIGGWVRTEALNVTDTDRTPIAVAAALNMASMPWDVRSASVGGTRGWTRLSLRFTASKANDAIRLSVGYGGGFVGKAWFDGVGIDEAGGSAGAPRKESVRTFGPAYRYPRGGWIYLHIEGEPYERGFQHGYLMAKEIEGYIDRSAAMFDEKNHQRSWDTARTMANALFLRGFDDEILREMRGIADGAAAAAGKYQGRKIDIEDVVALNTITELNLVRPASNVTATGLEGLDTSMPGYYDPRRDMKVTDRCSAFAATGKATKDGKMIIGHVTWWPQTLAEQTNILLDIQPVKGRRMLMQSYPGGIQSGTDWYQNDSGIVLTETTIAQTPFNAAGTPVAFRARKAIQYSESIDDVVKHFSMRNNGLYTNEWLIGDSKTDEIAMFALGTNKTKLWRSSKNEWFGGTEGFYWGNNNGKDLDVRLELMPDSAGAPGRVIFSPAPRDIAWLKFYDEYKGRIDEQFAFTAFRTAPLVAASTMDAKVVTKDMADRMMVWAGFGKPNEREWAASDRNKASYAGNNGLFFGGYHLFQAGAAPEAVAEVERERVAAVAKAPDKPAAKASFKDKLWSGWVLPASNADLWLVAGLTTYYRALEDGDLERTLATYRARYRQAAMHGDTSIRTIVPSTRNDHWHDIAQYKGALALDALRREIGDDRFFAAIKQVVEKNRTRPVSTEMLRASVGEPFDLKMGKWWLPGLPDTAPSNPWLAATFRSRLPTAVIVYGTRGEAGANRYAAEQLQKSFLDFYESIVPVRKDFEVGDADLRDRDVLFVGRPATNQALAAWQDSMKLDWSGGVFDVDGKKFGAESEALHFAAPNPLNGKHMVLVIAGNSPLETVRATRVEAAQSAATVLTDGRPPPD